MRCKDWFVVVGSGRDEWDLVEGWDVMVVKCDFCYRIIFFYFIYLCLLGMVVLNHFPCTSVHFL